MTVDRQMLERMRACTALVAGSRWQVKKSCCAGRTARGRPHKFDKHDVVYMSLVNRLCAEALRHNDGQRSGAHVKVVIMA